MIGGTYDSNGNLEATPPCVVPLTGKKYPFGRIYYGRGLVRPGEEFDLTREFFLERQIVQDPFPIDTDWLSVGHVDETVTILPGGGSQGFKIGLPSPERAYRILDLIYNDLRLRPGTSHLLTGRKFKRGDAWVSAEVSIADFLRTGIPALGLAAADLRRFNVTDVQSRIDGIRDDFRENVGVKIPDDIVEIPVIFMPDDPAAYSAGSPAFAESLTADSVNMLVVNRHCVVPHPFGPVVNGKDFFAELIARELKALRLTWDFLDDWYEYHILEGEVHCGTNTLRTPSQTRWWKYIP
jgi:protein-arginine deiminase